MIDTGRTIQQRRQDMDLSLAQLTQLLGGEPGESYLSRVERGKAPLSRDVARKLARAMRVPEPVLLNAAGHMTEDQISAAAEVFKKIVSSTTHRMALLSVLDRHGNMIETRRRMMAGDDEAFIIDIPDEPTVDDPYVGEALVYVARKPENGQGIIVEIDGQLSPWTYYNQAGNIWIENGRKERRAKGFKVRGVIARVATERTFIDS